MEHAGAASVDRSGRHLSVTSGSRFTTSIDWWCLEACAPFTSGVWWTAPVHFRDVGRRDRRSVLVAGRFVAGNATRSCLSRRRSGRAPTMRASNFVWTLRSSALRSTSSCSPLLRRWFGTAEARQPKAEKRGWRWSTYRWFASRIELQPGERQPHMAAILTRGNSRKRAIFYQHAGPWIVSAIDRRRF
jgi:hypothetical protein